MCCFLRCRPFVRAPLRDAVLVGFSSRSFPAHVGRGVTFILPRFSPNPSALRTGFHLFRQPFSFQFFFFFRLRVVFVIAVHWYRGTQNRFECVNKFKVTKKKLKDVFSCRIWGLVSRRRPGPPHPVLPYSLSRTGRRERFSG